LTFTGVTFGGLVGDDAATAAQLKFDRAPPAVRHRLRMQREREAAEPPAPA
jgi:hypothetical protein